MLATVFYCDRLPIISRIKKNNNDKVLDKIVQIYSLHINNEKGTYVTTFLIATLLKQNYKNVVVEIKLCKIYRLLKSIQAVRRNQVIWYLRN